MLMKKETYKQQGFMKIIKNSKDFWYGFLSIIYPQVCRICKEELPDQIEMICPVCDEKLRWTHFEKYKENPAESLFWGRVNLHFVYPLLYFKKGSSTQTLMHEIKYKGEKELGKFLGKKIGKIIAQREDWEKIDALIPIPLHSKKAFKRGYNQSLKIAEGLADETGAVIDELLVKKQHHASQTKKDRFERWENVENKFDVTGKTLRDYKHVAIVDDVLTTGSTVESAAKTLLQNNPSLKVSIITLAIAE